MATTRPLPDKPFSSLKDQKVMVPQARSTPVHKLTTHAPRHHFAAQRAGRPASATAWYEITDPTHMPDLHGQLGGVKVHFRDGKQLVCMTESQARFYLDSGSLKPYEGPEEPAK